MEKNKLIIYTDGGARGNPGPAAIGVVIGNKKFKQYIGETTNNVAEYQAVIFALRQARELLGDKASGSILSINLDSELIFSQINGDYRVKHVNLKLLFAEVVALMKDFQAVNFCLVPREKNKEADRLVNQALDERSV